MDYDPRTTSPRSSLRWRPTHTEDVTTTVTRKRATGGSPIGSPLSYRTLCGMILGQAKSHLPYLPDQGNLTNLWILVAIWMGASTLFTGHPRKTAKGVLTWVRDILTFQVSYPSEWKGLGELSTPISDTLVDEYGPVAFVQAVLASTQFYIVLNNHDLDLSTLEPLVKECEMLIGHWQSARNANGR